MPIDDRSDNRDASPSNGLSATTLEPTHAARTQDIEFLSLMAHDLRQPLTIIMGFAVLLEDHWAKLSDEKKREYVGHISRRSRWMIALVDDILTGGESSTGSVAFQPAAFSVAQLIEETIHDLDPDDEGRLACDTGKDLPLGWGDRVKQRRVLQNLLDNAIKYSASGTPIHVGLSVSGDMLAVSVADRGLGIPPNEVPTIFERFNRVRDSEHVASIKGTGLGLFVCRAMVESQGGEIEVESNTHGIGSVFTYTIPIARRGSDSRR